MNFAGGLTGGLFGIYNKSLKYKNLKNQELSERSGLENNLNQANNNLAITGEQAPLVPQQAAEGFAARGVAQSTFGNGLGDQWGAGMNPPPQYQNSAGQAVAPNGMPVDGGPSQAQGASLYRLPDIKNVTPTPTSGQGQGIGTGLQRARDLAGAMVSNAESGQKSASDALKYYNKTIKNNRRLFYSDMAEQYVNMIFGLIGGA